MKKLLVIFIFIGLSSCKHYYCIEYENTTNGYKDIQNQWGGFYPQDHIDKLNSEPQHYHCYED
jgi:hypothetical protein